jgi:coproporphyrinogen III oxidase
MPPLVKWTYKYNIEKNSLEEKLYNDFLVPKKWI